MDKDGDSPRVWRGWYHVSLKPLHDLSLCDVVDHAGDDLPAVVLVLLVGDVRPVAVSLGGEGDVHGEHRVDQRSPRLGKFLVAHVTHRLRERGQERVDSSLDVRRGVKRALDHHPKPTNLVQNFKRGARDVPELLLGPQLIETFLRHQLLRQQADRACFVRGRTVLVVAVHHVGTFLGVLRGNREPGVAGGNDGDLPRGKIARADLAASERPADHGTHRQRLVRGDVADDEALDVRRRGPDAVDELAERRRGDPLERRHLRELAVLAFLQELVQQTPRLPPGFEPVVLEVLQPLLLDLLEARVGHVEVGDRLEVRLDQVRELIVKPVEGERQHGVLTHHVQPGVETRELRGVPDGILQPIVDAQREHVRAHVRLRARVDGG